jgi:hypothetical protein
MTFYHGVFDETRRERDRMVGLIGLSYARIAHRFSQQHHLSKWPNPFLIILYYKSGRG